MDESLEPRQRPTEVSNVLRDAHAHGVVRHGWYPQVVEGFEHAVVHDVGALSEVIKGSARSWNRSDGAISLERRISGDPSFEDRVVKSLSGVNHYFQKVDPSAPTRCSDPRPSDRGAFALQGPQVFAGSVGSALARHIVEPERGGKTLGEDLRMTLAEFKEHGIACGGHVDERYGVVPDCTGCSGIDRIHAIFDKLSDKRAAAGLRSLAMQISNNWTKNDCNAVLERFQALREKSETYFGNGHRMEALKAIEETARSHEHKPIEVLKGTNKGVALIVNTVKDETFNNTAFSNDNRGDIQAFNYDIWEVEEIAGKLYPDNQKQRTEYMISRVMLAGATAMVMSDGSLRALVRMKA